MHAVIDYASVVFAGFTVISAGWYFVRGRKAFTGPPLAKDEVVGEVVEIPCASDDIQEKEKSDKEVSTEV
jgi:hypothetical protein